MYIVDIMIVDILIIDILIVYIPIYTPKFLDNFFGITPAIHNNWRTFLLEIRVTVTNTHIQRHVTACH